MTPRYPRGYILHVLSDSIISIPDFTCCSQKVLKNTPIFYSKIRIVLQTSQQTVLIDNVS